MQIGGPRGTRSPARPVLYTSRSARGGKRLPHIAATPRRQRALPHRGRMENSAPTPRPPAQPRPRRRSGQRRGLEPPHRAARQPAIEQVLRLAWLRSGDRRRTALAGRCLRPSCARRRPGRRAARAAHERAVRRGRRHPRGAQGSLRQGGPVRRAAPRPAAGSVTAALASLRDRVPPLPFERIRATVEAELGAPLAALVPRVRDRCRSAPPRSPRSTGRSCRRGSRWR